MFFSSPNITSCKMIVQHLNQGSDSDTTKIQNIFITTKIPYVAL